MKTFALSLACLPAVLGAPCALAQDGATSPAAAAVASASESPPEWIASPRPSLRVSRQMPPAEALATQRAVPLAARDPAAAESPTAWTIELKDRTLHETLRRWSEQAGWQLVWEADRDFPIDAEFALQTDFVAALDTVMRSLAATDYPLQAMVNPHTRVVRIVRYMDSTRR